VRWSTGHNCSPSRTVWPDLKAQTRILHDGASHALVDADPAVACCVGPTLLGTRDADGSERVHDTEVLRPGGHAHALPRPGACAGAGATRPGFAWCARSIGSDAGALAQAAVALADSHGRVHVISPDVADSQTGHGNAMP